MRKIIQNQNRALLKEKGNEGSKILLNNFGISDIEKIAKKIPYRIMIKIGI